MNKEKLVRITDYYIDENTRDTMISSRHHPIISGFENLSDEEILCIKKQYIQYEKEYANPINKVKRLVNQIRRK